VHVRFSVQDFSPPPVMLFLAAGTESIVMNSSSPCSLLWYLVLLLDLHIGLHCFGHFLIYVEDLIFSTLILIFVYRLLVLLNNFMTMMFPWPSPDCLLIPFHKTCLFAGPQIYPLSWTHDDMGP
jgi:hypothetical protein